MKYFKILLFGILISSCSDDSIIKGQVLNENQKSIDSVKVLVNGTDIYTYSDENGIFKINTNDLNDELMFEKEGYQLKFQKFNNRTNNKIVLKRD